MSRFHSWGLDITDVGIPKGVGTYRKAGIAI